MAKPDAPQEGEEKRRQEKLSQDIAIIKSYVLWAFWIAMILLMLRLVFGGLASFFG